MTLSKLAAGVDFPSWTLQTLDGEPIQLASPIGEADWRMVVIYRGQHCPLCTRYLTQLEVYRSEFLALGVDVVAVSADSKEQAQKQCGALNLSFPVAYGLTIEQMQALGLYISYPKKVPETDHVFAEPATFIVNANGMMQVASISNAPFARPELDVLIRGIAYARDPKNNVPIRGTYTNDTADVTSMSDAQA